MTPIPLFCGFDEREAIGFHTFAASVISRSSLPVSITPLHLKNLARFYEETHKDGTNAFIYSRFLVPYLMGYTGSAIFADGADMLCRADIADLWELRNPFLAVQCVQHNYKTKHPRKYVGTSMEADNRDYPRKNWSSLMIVNCAHYAWRRLTPDRIAGMTGEELHGLRFVEDRYIGALKPEWNWLADEYGENEQARILHWTAGIPWFNHYANAPHSAEWWKWINETTKAYVQE